MSERLVDGPELRRLLTNARSGKPVRAKVEVEVDITRPRIFDDIANYNSAGGDPLFGCYVI